MKLLIGGMLFFSSIAFAVSSRGTRVDLRIAGLDPNDRLVLIDLNSKPRLHVACSYFDCEWIEYISSSGVNLGYISGMGSTSSRGSWGSNYRPGVKQTAKAYNLLKQATPDCPFQVKLLVSPEGSVALRESIKLPSCALN